MVRTGTYKRTTNRGTFSREDMLLAVDDVINKGISLRKAAAEHQLNYKTLSRYVHLKRKDETAIPNTVGYQKTRLVFTDEIEMQLVEYLVTASKIFHGLTMEELRELAYELADSNSISMPASWAENGKAGVDWARGFMDRHGNELSLRTPEATSLQRMTSFNRHNVNMFYNNLEEALQKGFTADNIWNIDETGVTTVQSPTKQIAKRGEKRVGAVVAQERGTLVTVCCGVSASGNHIPPFLIFPRVNAQDHWRLNLPPGSLVEGHPKATGWMTRENFQSYLKHFVKHTKPTEDSPVLLLLDNHKSHISLEAIHYCRDNYVTMLSFPPHCSHELQPLDKTVYGPFKTFCNQATDRWCHDVTNRGKPMTIHTLPSIVNYGFTHAFSQKNIVSGFKSTGIYPFDRNVIPEDRYLPSYTTDRPLPETENSASCSTSTASTKKATTAAMPESTSVDTTTTATNESTFAETTVSLPQATATTPETPKAKTSSSFLSPFALRPFGKAPPRNKQTKRKSMSSCIYTSSPVKRQLEEQLARKTKPKTLKKCRAPYQNPDSDSDLDNFSLHDSSDTDNSSEDEECDGRFQLRLGPVTETVRKDDYVLAAFEQKGGVQYLVGVAIADENEDSDHDIDVDVSFMRKSSKVENKFVKPIVEDIGSVPKHNIHAILPRPVATGTSRTKSGLVFNTDFSKIKLWR